MPRRSNQEHPRITARRHALRVERAVREFAPRFWGPARRLAQAWLRRALTVARAPLESLELRLYDFEKEWLAAELEAAGVMMSEAELELLLGKPITDFQQSITTSSMFLAHDPRLELIEEYTRRILEDDLSSFWQSLTDPKLLATRLVNLRAQGKSYIETTHAISTQYGTEFYRAERLVRSSYNSATNYAHYIDLAEHYETLRWITAEDARVRRPEPGSKWDHVSANNQTTPVGTPFVVTGERLLYPGDRSLGASAGNIVNCRCTLVGDLTAQPTLFPSAEIPARQPILFPTS